MLVYRVENEEGRGPYSGTGHEWRTRDHEAPTHPGPFGDGMEGFNCDWIFGFKSIAQLKTWFDTEELSRLGARNVPFNIAIYEVPSDSVLLGNKQLCFDSDQAKLIQRCKINARACAVWCKDDAIVIVFGATG